MKQKYIEPEMKIFEFEIVDVLTSSTPVTAPADDNDVPWEG